MPASRCCKCVSVCPVIPNDKATCHVSNLFFSLVQKRKLIDDSGRPCNLMISVIFAVFTVPALLVNYCICDPPHQWAIELDGGLPSAENLAKNLGITLKGQIGSLNAFLFEGSPPTPQTLSLYRQNPNEARRVARRAVDTWISDVSQQLSKDPNVIYFEKQVAKKRVKRALTFNDPFWSSTWYYAGEGKKGMNIQPAWGKGYSGRNVVVAVLDDGLEKAHPDLAPNYDPEASWDVIDNDNDPTPRYDIANSNSHGTRCAGEIVAVANNSVCTVGAAFNAKIGGVRMLDGAVTDAVEAGALSWKPQHIDIYSASWGPDDDGLSLDTPGVLAQQAFLEGVTKGRQGKGNIFVWASGNGGIYLDSCAYDGYTSSRYVISVSSVSEKGEKPWYLEECSSTLAATYSSGNEVSDRQVVTTDIRNGCTDSHTGTSASAAMAAGLMALVVEANRQLTWRDVQHLVVETSRDDPITDGQWFTNKIGRKVSSRYGFGLLDSMGLVQMAEQWKLVPEQHVCKSPENNGPFQIKDGADLVFATSLENCINNNLICHVEHVQVQITMDLAHRGAISVFLMSPLGTISQMLPPRLIDDQPGSFNAWLLTSVQFWGEPPNGRWIIKVAANGSNTGTLSKWQLIVYGTSLPPPSSKFYQQMLVLGSTCRQTTANLTLLSTTPSVPSSDNALVIGIAAAGLAFVAVICILSLVLLIRRYHLKRAAESTADLQRAQGVYSVPGTMPIVNYGKYQGHHHNEAPPKPTFF